MPNKTTHHEIRTRIDTFLAEMSELVRLAALGSVHAALGGELEEFNRRGSGRPRGPGRPPKAAARGQRVAARTGGRIRRSAEDLEKIAARVLTYVKSNAGQRLEQIGKALQTDTSVLKRPIANLVAARKLRTTGQKRGTMYFAGGARGGASKAPRKAKGARKSKTRRSGSRKKAARRARPVVLQPVRSQRAKPGRKTSRSARPSRARAVANQIAMDAAAISTALP